MKLRECTVAVAVAVAVVGCTVLNSEYGQQVGESAAPTGGAASSTTGPRSKTSTGSTRGGDSSGGTSSGSRPTGPGVLTTTGGDSEDAGVELTGAPETACEGRPTVGTVADDAFLVECKNGFCQDANYGATEQFPVADFGGEANHGMMLLRVPEDLAGALATRVELTIAADLQKAVLGNGFEARLHAVEPECRWEEGSLDGDIPAPSRGGVTFNRCSAVRPWGQGGILAHIDAAWSFEPLRFDDLGAIAGPFTVAMTANEATDVPGTVLLTTNIDDSGFDVFASESGDSPEIAICD